MKGIIIIDDKIKETRKYLKSVEAKWNKGDTSVLERMSTLMSKLDKLNIIQRDLIALEIIKNKYVDIDYLKNDCHFELCLYNKFIFDDKQLTQDEINILKEAL